jgi:hypothetical protein
VFPSERKLRQDVKVLDSFCHTVIAGKRRLAEEDGNSALGPDLISRFLDKADKVCRLQV